MNATRPAPVSIATVGAIQAVNNASLICLSKMLASSPKYAHEATAVWQGSHLCIHLFGRNHRGQEVIGSTTETFAGSGGGRWGADGIDLGGEIPNPISRMANVETNEAMYPIRYLFRRRMPDSGGAGEFRGGTGGEYAMVPHDAPTGEVGFVISGKGVDFPMSHGLTGGYPGSPGRYEICRGAQPADGGTAPSYRLGEIGGTHEVVSFGVYHVHNEDVFYVRWNGGGGLGDPLQRDPQAVARDVAESVVSAVAARALYGVICSPEGRVDTDATQRRRDEMRAQRMQTNVTVPSGLRCPACGEAATSGDAGTAAVHERLMSEIVPSYTTGPLTALAEIVCRRCGALLDTQVTMQGAGPLLNDQSPEGRP